MLSDRELKLIHAFNLLIKSGEWFIIALAERKFTIIEEHWFRKIDPSWRYTTNTKHSLIINFDEKTVELHAGIIKSFDWELAISKIIELENNRRIGKFKSKISRKYDTEIGLRLEHIRNSMLEQYLQFEMSKNKPELI